MLSVKIKSSTLRDGVLETRRRKAVIVTLLLVYFLFIFLPFLALLWNKLAWDRDVSWHTVFIPLWVCDGIFVCVSGFLLLFTCGATEDALFSVSQIVFFLLMTPCGVAFKVLLAIYLDDGPDEMPDEYVLIPILVLEALMCFCGSDMWLCGGRKERRRR
jgi:Transmembrane Fragile-X-F protein